MKRKYLIIGLGFFLLFGSELSAQQTINPAKLSGRAVRSSHTPGLSSRRRTHLNNQVINGVLKQNLPTKAGQRQISSIERRLRLRLPVVVIGERSRKGNSSIANIWVPGWEGVLGEGRWINIILELNWWNNWYPR